MAAAAVAVGRVVVVSQSTVLLLETELALVVSLPSLLLDWLLWSVIDWPEVLLHCGTDDVWLLLLELLFDLLLLLELLLFLLLLLLLPEVAAALPAENANTSAAALAMMVAAFMLKLSMNIVEAGEHSSLMS